jgi:hypothetical protein
LNVENAIELAIAPEVWEIELRDGARMKVLAHAYHVERGEAVFSLLFKGRPNFEVESLRIPLEVLPPDFS